MNRKERRAAASRGRGTIDRNASTPPGGPSAWLGEQLGMAVRHLHAGRIDDAEGICREICRVDPNQVDSLHLLGVIAHRRGRNDVASDLIKRALALKPDYAGAHFSLGNVLSSQGRLNEAAVQFERTLALQPGHVDAHNNLGIALVTQGRLDAALAHFERALALKPDDAKVHYNLGKLRREQGRPDEAAAHLRRALALKPDYADAHNSLGIILMEQRKLDEAATHFERALALNPHFVEAHNNLGNLRREQGRLTEAEAHYGRALALQPDHAGAKLARCMVHLPFGYTDESEIARQRAAYQDALQALGRDTATRAALRDLAGVVGSSQPFLLPYQGCNDRDLQSAYGSLVCRAMAERYPPAALAPRPGPGEKLRIGIVSGYFLGHSNWKIPIRGWLSQLDRSRFQLFGYYTGSETDAETTLAATFCSRFVQGPLPLDRWRQAILDDAPHVLIYPEVGMDSVAAQLAAQRLAPVQCNSWGHPQTSGYPTLDYFLSSDLMEPPDAQDHYTERLIRLPNLSIYYESPVDAPVALDRAELGLRPTATVYWCSQTLFKYLPQFDQVFPRIGRQVGDCQFTFIQITRNPHVTELFRKRLDRAFAAFGLNAADHCVLLPPLAHERFVAAIGQCDLVLDSIGWSGCNSTLESLVHDLPIVTMTGDLMRGRHTAAILAMMGIGETTAQTIDEYVSIAAGLAQNPGARMALKSKISQNKHRLYRDRDCILALEGFLDQVARRGTAAA
jgi:protein O-GlcNAc transferase